MSRFDLAKTAAAALAIAIGFTATAANAAALVVRSTGPSSRAYPPGKSLDVNTRITLRENDVVMVLDGNGTRTFRGPGIFNPNVASNVPAGLNTRLAGGNPNDTRRRLGVHRGFVPGGPRASDPRTPTIWSINAARTSTACVADNRAVELWRPNGDVASTATITNVADGHSATLEWAAGVYKMGWPATLPVAEGAQYRISWSGNPTPATIRFSLFGANPLGLDATAQLLIQRGCEAQLDVLIDTVSLPERAAPPAG